MKKYIVLSVNDNPDYLYYTPLTCWAWRQFGWEPVLMYQSDNYESPLILQVAKYVSVIHSYRVSGIEGYRSETITQMSRLYAAAAMYPYSGYLMTGDIDMIPLSDYWQPSDYNLTVWGHDLTGFGHYPICYIGMRTDRWLDEMHLTGGKSVEEHIRWDLANLPQAKDPDFYKYWFTDQDLITERLKHCKPTLINRGQYSNGFAVGRVDRGAWTLNHSQFIDCHMFQQLYHKNNKDKFDKTMELLISIWPDEDFGWFIDYTNEFRKLTGHV